MSLANAVAQSEVPIRRANNALREMGTVIKNTARWQLSSTMIHGLIRGVSSAFSYAKDLDKSLNNIYIITNKNVTEMAKLAE
jgi:hypothetical protein